MNIVSTLLKNIFPGTSNPIGLTQSVNPVVDKVSRIAGELFRSIPAKLLLVAGITWSISRIFPNSFIVKKINDTFAAAYASARSFVARRTLIRVAIFKKVISPYSSKKGADSMSSLPSVLMQKIGTLGDHRSRTTIALTCSQFKGDIIEATKQVKRLKVETIDVSSKESLIGLLKAHPNLEKLDLSSVRYLVDDDVLKQVAKLTQLTSLNLARCRQITDFALLAALNQLTSLNLQGCNQITDLAPLAGMTKLTSLYLRRCTQITDEGLATFRAARPDVKISR